MSRKSPCEPIRRRSRRAPSPSRLVLAAGLASALLAACSDTPSGDGPRPLLRLTHLHADPDPIEGGRIVDAEGREVLLRGVNVNALVEYWQGTPFPITFPFAEEDADRVAGIGWNAVRLLLSWSRVEPAPGEIDEAYLERADAIIELLESRGIYAIVDLHQDAWGATLAAAPDEICPPPSEPALGWDGAPAWATLDGGAARCTLAGLRETSAAVGAAWSAFWSDAPGPGEVGIRTRYARMLGRLAARWAGDASVAGFDLMNEPGAFGATQGSALSAMYADALREIRTAERAAGAEPHLVFFEPSAIWSAAGQGPPPEFPHDRDVVYSPHIYTGGFNGGPITRRAFEIALEEARGFGGAPVLTGEWGSDPRRAADPADGYFLHHQALQDDFRFGATLWTWRESCGDPHKVADYRAGRVPYVWGEFEVDCRTNAVLGVREPLIAQLTRAYLRAAPGRIESVRYDDATGVFAATGVGAIEGTELLAFYPTAKHGSPAVAVEGLRDVSEIEAPGGNVHLTATSAGGAWSLRAEPR